VRIAFIGLGEAAGAFITGWGADRAGDIAAFDIKTTKPETADEILKRAKTFGIAHCETLQDAVFSGHEFLCTFIKTGVCRDYGRPQSVLCGCCRDGARLSKTT